MAGISIHSTRGIPTTWWVRKRCLVPSIPPTPPHHQPDLAPLNPRPISPSLLRFPPSLPTPRTPPASHPLYTRLFQAPAWFAGTLHPHTPHLSCFLTHFSSPPMCVATSFSLVYILLCPTLLFNTQVHADDSVIAWGSSVASGELGLGEGGRTGSPPYQAPHPLYAGGRGSIRVCR